MTIVKAAAVQLSPVLYTASGLPRRLATAALAVTLALFVPVLAFGQAAPEPAQKSASLGLPDVPTTRILAIGRLTSRSTPGAMKEVLPQEVRDTVKLYLEGKIEQ
jgi:hypothetical protein